MDDGYKKQLQLLDSLIIEQEKLSTLAQTEGWHLLLEKLGEVRVSAMQEAIAAGDTTDAKAFARAVSLILNLFHEISSKVKVNDLIDRRDLLKQEIDSISNQELEYQKSFGASGII